VYLTNGFEIDFTKSGEWDEIDGNINKLPQSIVDLLPAGIMEYVEKQFTDQTIVKVNKEHFGYEIELNDNFEIHFNSHGDFIGYDD
jgi:hypothetical protein